MDNQPATPDLSHIERFVNDRTLSTANREILFLEVSSLGKFIKSLPANVATGLDRISAPLLKLSSPSILESLTKFLRPRRTPV